MPAKSHWMSDARFYGIYCILRRRCYDKNLPKYQSYWARWIKCLWNNFEEFMEDMYESYLEHCKIYWEKNTTIDRIDNDWHYYKDNCEWSTLQKQARNRRSCRMYKWKCIIEWCEELNLPYSTIRARINRWWWSIEKALNTPIKKSSKK